MWAGVKWCVIVGVLGLFGERVFLWVDAKYFVPRDRGL